MGGASIGARGGKEVGGCVPGAAVAEIVVAVSVETAVVDIAFVTSVMVAGGLDVGASGGSDER